MPQYLKCLAAVPCDLSLITIYLFQAAAVFSPWFFLRYRRYINHLLTYLLNISQGTGSTVATRLRCGGILTYHPTASLPPSLTMKEFFFWKSVKKSHSSRHTIDSLLIRTLTVLLIGACVARLALSSITQPNSGRVALVAVRVTSCTPHSNNTRLNPRRPAHVVQWSNHLGAMCSRAWRSQWPRIVEPRPGCVRLLKKNYFK